MAFKPGESGNPGGGVREKQFLKTLERAIAQDNSQRLRDAAEKLLNLAAAGEPWAIGMLADRLDGKATQQVDMRVSRPSKELSDDELGNIASRSGNGASVAEESSEKPSSVH